MRSAEELQIFPVDFLSFLIALLLMVVGESTQHPTRQSASNTDLILPALECVLLHCPRGVRAVSNGNLAKVTRHAALKLFD
jgi:hypothetical protein